MMLISNDLMILFYYEFILLRIYFITNLFYYEFILLRIYFHL